MNTNERALLCAFVKSLERVKENRCITPKCIGDAFRAVIDITTHFAWDIEAKRKKTQKENKVMELLKQLNAIRDATNRSLLMNNNRTDSENVPNTIPPRTPSGAGDDVSDDEERMCEKEEEENENEEEKKMRRRPFKYAKAISQMMMRKGGGKGGAGTDDDENVDGDDREATTRITCASQNGVACAFGFANGDLLVADAETGERVALFKRESSEDDDDDDGDDKNNENNNNNNKTIASRASRLMPPGRFCALLRRTGR